jgi:hypothetical protein
MIPPNWGFGAETDNLSAKKAIFEYLARMQTLMRFTVLASLVFAFSAHALPTSYTELNDYVVPAPNQGEVNTCLYMASTGALEILLSKKLGLHNPPRRGPTDLSERYTISAYGSSRSKSWFEDAFLKYDSGEAVLDKDMPFTSFDVDGNINYSVWNDPANFDTAPRITVPKIDTVFLFSVGDKYSRGVLNQSHLDQVKAALVQYKSPIITVGNDEDYWHVTVITGYDDNVVGDCYELDSSVCEGKIGAIYVRDSFGVRLEARSYEWFIRRQNSAAVAVLKE